MESHIVELVRLADFLDIAFQSWMIFSKKSLATTFLVVLSAIPIVCAYKSLAIAVEAVSSCSIITHSLYAFGLIIEIYTKKEIH
ncbi:hypothetical protein [Oceanobacillus picturae]|uniref:hypothetical protein n=1 Tax=Oceanobacillus picturae TaxID=171693 RepID=UPI0036274162